MLERQTVCSCVLQRHLVNKRGRYTLSGNTLIYSERITFTKLVIWTRKTRGCFNFQLCFLFEVFDSLLSYRAGLDLGTLQACDHCESSRSTYRKSVTIQGRQNIRRMLNFKKLSQDFGFTYQIRSGDICKNKQEHGKYHCLAVVHTARKIDVNRHTVHHTEVIYSYSITNKLKWPR